MEIGGVEKIMLVDTVGVDAEPSFAEKSAESVEIALMLIANDSFELELGWISKLKKNGATVLVVITQVDKLVDAGKSLAAAVKEVSGIETVCVSVKTKFGIDELSEKIVSLLSKVGEIK